MRGVCPALCNTSPQHPDGFMMRFYALSALVTPVLSWGFLGTNPVMTSKCNRFKVCVPGVHTRWSSPHMTV